MIEIFELGGEDWLKMLSTSFITSHKLEELWKGDVLVKTSILLRIQLMRMKSS